MAETTPTSGAVEETPQDIARDLLQEFDADAAASEQPRAAGGSNANVAVSLAEPSKSPAEDEAARRVRELKAEELVAKAAEREQKAQLAIKTALVTATARERGLYAALVVVAIITAALAVLAASLLIGGKGSTAVASAAIALLPGVGTLLLRRLRQDERNRISKLEDDRDKHVAAMQAIEFALSLDEPQRAQEITALIAEMRKRGYN